MYFYERIKSNSESIIVIVLKLIKIISIQINFGVMTSVMHSRKCISRTTALYVTSTLRIRESDYQVKQQI